MDPARPANPGTSNSPVPAYFATQPSNFLLEGSTKALAYVTLGAGSQITTVSMAFLIERSTIFSRRPDVADRQQAELAPRRNVRLPTAPRRAAAKSAQNREPKTPPPSGLRKPVQQAELPLKEAAAKKCAVKKSPIATSPPPSITQAQKGCAYSCSEESRMKFVGFLLTLLSSASAAAAATTPYSEDGIYSPDVASTCAEAPQGDIFTNGFDGGCPQLTVSPVEYGPYVQTARPNVDVTEWVNIWGHSNPTDEGSAWPGNAGAAPVIMKFNRNSVLCIHFKTSDTISTGFFTYPRNRLLIDLALGGIDLVISKTKCDFTPNGGSSRFNALPTDDVALWWRGSGGNPAYYAILDTNSDYYLNIRANLRPGENEPQLPYFPLYLVRN